ncbi:MAG: large conductance mechanosensitive channel protein MscL [Kouleothrix sp.]|jgi:large conductance mechanosensitive channel|nr:large conductance mechanosensitive channel protein MscL [Kouleothrix sp.]
MLKEFREFIAKGNVLDLAVAVIIGAAFGGIVTSLVEDIINPIIGIIVGKPDFSSIFINLSGKEFATYAAAKEAGAQVIGIGAFVTAIINFLIIAFVIFMIVRSANNLKKAEPPAPPAGPTKEEQLLTEIRDALRAQR